MVRSFLLGWLLPAYPRRGGPRLPGAMACTIVEPLGIGNR
jgi:hypothetical protein